LFFQTEDHRFANVYIFSILYCNKSRDLTTCDTLKACSIVNIKSRVETSLFGDDTFVLDRYNDQGYSIRCDVNGVDSLDFIKFFYDAKVQDEFGLPRYMGGDSDDGAYINQVAYLSTCGTKTLKIEGHVWSNLCFEKLYRINILDANGKSCDNKVPTSAPLKPATVAPVKPPSKPTTSAPVKPPIKAAPVQSPAGYPANGPAPLVGIGVTVNAPNQFPLVGVGVGIAVNATVATPTIQVPTVGAGVAVNATVAIPTIQVPTVGAGVAVNATVATPTIQVPTVGAGVAVNATVATPTIQVPTVGAGVAVNATVATPTIQVPTVGAGVAVNATVATPTIQVPKVGAGVAVNATVATPTIQVPLVGAGVAVNATVATPAIQLPILGCTNDYCCPNNSFRKLLTINLCLDGFDKCECNIGYSRDEKNKICVKIGLF
jgi:hypothetical protein